VLILLEQSADHQGSGGELPVVVILGALTVLTLLAAVTKYLVTKWALDGATLRIETGLFRRDARQLPLARIQAVDVVKPFVARMFGLAELRMRLAGSGRPGGRLAYLSEPVALDLRARLLAGHHGLDQATPEPAERPVAAVPTGRLVGAALLSTATLIAAGLLVAIVVLLTVSPAAAAGAVGTLLVYLLSFGRITWRRVTDQFGFTVGLAPDGIRVKRGLFSTVSETVPFARVQAVRKIQPLMWRLAGWCRLEVDVAGSPGQEQGTRSGRVTKALLPVGSYEMADELFSSLLGLRQFELSRPPARARLRAPLSFHFLAAGCDGAVVAASTGRLQKVTTWVPLEKVQSVRRVQGPVQRALNLATVHVDAAGRAVRAELRDRSTPEADSLFELLVDQSRAGRRRASARMPAGNSRAPEGSAPPRSPAAPGAPSPLNEIGQPLAPPEVGDQEAGGGGDVGGPGTTWP
jgi:putative membrane protein